MKIAVLLTPEIRNTGNSCEKLKIPYNIFMRYKKDIKGYEGYKIDRAGAVWSCWRRKIIRNKSNGRLITIVYYLSKEWKKRKTSNHIGYEQVVLKIKDKKYVCKDIHRLLAETFISNPENKPYVCHKDGNPSNNNLKNLYWGSATDNSLDSVRHGTHWGLRNKGENQHQSKLNEKQVRVIKYLFTMPRHLTQKTISEIFKVSYVTIGDIYRGETWKHVII